GFYKCQRASLQDMLSAASLTAAFSPRFLRETLVFPYQLEGGGIALAVSDPTDLAARRAAEIVLGPNIEIKIAAFDDVATVLDQRLTYGEAEDGGAADGP